MHKTHTIFLIFVFLLMSGQVLAQTTLYVTSGANVIQLSASTSSATVVDTFTHAGSAFEGLAFGPDGKLYVCDPTHGAIFTLDPGTSTFTSIFTFTSSGPQNPQCGRFTAAGDFLVTSGSGVWKFSCIAPVRTLGGAATPLCSPSFTPTQVFTAAQVGSITQGITQSKPGDLLIVDQTDGKVWKSALDSTSLTFGNPSQLIPGLTSPVGIARASTGPIFVVEHTTSNKGDLKVFVPATSATSPCVASSIFGNQQPNFAGISAGDTVYVATATSSKGGVWSVTADFSGNSPTCAATQLLTLTSLPLTGIALSPTSATRPVPPPATITSGSFNFTFGFSTFGLANVLNTTTPCTASVTETQSLQGSLSTGIEALISNIGTVTNPDGSTSTISSDTRNAISPVPQLGEAGFDTLYDVNSSNCAAASPTGFRISIAGFVSSFTNPRVVGCDGGTCTIRNTLGFYPIASFGDPDIDVGGGFSKFFLVNLPLTTTQSELGNFCGFQNPLTNVPPQDPATFGSGQNVAVKFKLAVASTPQGLNCPNGPYVTDAVALLSVARIADSAGNTVFDPCTPTSTVCPLSPSGNSEDSPIFDVNPKNKQYNFSLSLKGYSPGLYTLNVLFLSNNAPTVTTEFIVQ